MNTIQLKILKYLLLFLMYNIACFKDSVTKVPEIIFKEEIFISDDYYFGKNEALNKPSAIRENPVTNEIVVCDFGNNCLYFFDNNGNFIRKVGQIGQGPGDFLGNRVLEIDKDGEIYVLEDFNMRISVLSKYGEYISSFRVNGYSRFSTYFITDKKEILINMPENGYFITILNRKGETVNKIGPISEEIKKYVPLFSPFTVSYIFYDNIGENYYVFVPGLRLINVYGVNFEMKKSVKINELLKGHYIKEIYTPYQKFREYEAGRVGIRTTNLMQNVFYNGNYFFIKYLPDYEKDDAVIIVLDKELNLKEKLILNAPKTKIKYSDDFIVLNNNTILFPIQQAKVIKFLPLKK